MHKLLLIILDFLMDWLWYRFVSPWVDYFIQKIPWFSDMGDEEEIGHDGDQIEMP